MFELVNVNDEIWKYFHLSYLYGLDRDEFEQSKIGVFPFILYKKGISLVKKIIYTLYNKNYLYFRIISDLLSQEQFFYPYAIEETILYKYHCLIFDFVFHSYKLSIGNDDIIKWWAMDYQLFRFAKWIKKFYKNFFIYVNFKLIELVRLFIEEENVNTIFFLLNSMYNEKYYIDLTNNIEILINKANLNLLNLLSDPFFKLNSEAKAKILLKKLSL